MRNAAIGFLCGALLAGSAVGVYSHRSQERALSSMWFANELYKLQAAGRQLSMFEESRLDEARQLVQHELQWSIETAYQLMTSEQPGIHGQFPFPNMIEGIRRAEPAVARLDGDGSLAARYEAVAEYVQVATAK